MLAIALLPVARIKKWFGSLMYGPSDMLWRENMPRERT
jgi:hypothetical protein